MTSQDIRRQFIDFFVQKHGHTFVPSSPVVPHDDPTLLFTNAGMNQFKPMFLGTEKRDYVRAVNTQKCIRAGGKHNDLDDVGRSRRHHTFFEMLGNWSFGDYFKREAIEWAWELLTQVWKLDPSRLHVSCYEGDEKNGVPRDTEAAKLWKEISGLPDAHIHFFGKDNFWEMGETGPCGPCSEIHIDRTPDKSGGRSVNGEDPRVMEIWNLVFIQYNRNADRSLTPLPAKHVDTGMGFERICQVIQGKDDNYGIDLFVPFFEALTKLTGIRYTGQYPKTNAADPVAEGANPQLRHDIAFRVIADHLRMATFAITDGALPGNRGRDSVVRSVIRRAVRFGYQQLGFREPFLWQLVPVVANSMGNIFPEVEQKQNHVTRAIMHEEESFFRTLERGIGLFEEAAARSAFAKILSGADIFDLHTTYGFPPDMTKQMALERGLVPDMEDYKRRFKVFQEESGKSRAAAVQSVADWKGLPATDDRAKYSRATATAKVMAYGQGSPFTIVATAGSRLETGDEAAIVLDRTSFYAEQGGQVGDTGTIRATSGVFRVDQTTRVGDYVLHEGVVTEGDIGIDDSVSLEVDPSRTATMQNHTGTHLANWALREVLGDDVQQKGSLVDPEKLRFDYSHGKSMTDAELTRVETLVCENISKDLPVYAEEASQQDAMKINGLRAVFGEKYPPMVRVVSIGAPVKDLLADPSNPKWRGYSIEFCGGTHLGNASDVGQFVITSEEAVSKGVRRIVALTAEKAKQSLAAERELDLAVAAAERAPESELRKLLNDLQKHAGTEGLPLRARRRAQHAISQLQQRQRAWEKSQKSSASSIDVAAVASDLAAKGPLIVASIEGANDEQLRAVIDSIKKRRMSFGVMLGTTDGQKVSFVAAVSDDLIAKGLKAGDWIRETAKIAGGGGGGRPQMAQAGGKDPAKLAEALETARKYASERAI